MAVRVLAFLAGVTIVLFVISAAVRTVVVPRAEQVSLNRVAFRVMGHLFDLQARRQRDWVDEDRVLARYAPFTLMTLPVLWVVGLIAGFTLVFWAIGVGSLEESFELSGSSVTTLGFRSAGSAWATTIAIVEALLGLLIVALLIAFLPTIYGLFSRREVLIANVHTLAEPGEDADHPHGRPPSPESLIVRAHAIGRLDDLDDVWREWGVYFHELEEAHTSFPALNHFRSIRPNRSWILAAGVVLDSAALVQSTLRVPSSYQAQLMIRSGFTALRRISDFYAIPYDHRPAPGDPIDLPRDRFDALYDRLVAAGVPVRDDREQAWRDFAGWRVNYDAVLVALIHLTSAPPSSWFDPVAPPPGRRARPRRTTPGP